MNKPTPPFDKLRMNGLRPIKSLFTYVKNIFGYLRSKKYLVCIQFSSKSLDIALLKPRARRLSIKRRQHVKLDDLECPDGAVSNPTKIQQHIVGFLQTHNLHKPNAIICAPNQSTKSPLLQKLITLQTTLCMAKAPLRIQAVINQPLLPDPESPSQYIKNSIYRQALAHDQLTHLKGYNHHSPLAWIARFSITSLALVTLLFIIYHENNDTMNKASYECQELTDKTNILKKKVFYSYCFYY